MNFNAKKINFSSINVKVHSYYNRKTSVNGRKFHLLEMKIHIRKLYDHLEIKAPMQAILICNTLIQNFF